MICQVKNWEVNLSLFLALKTLCGWLGSKHQLTGLKAPTNWGGGGMNCVSRKIYSSSLACNSNRLSVNVFHFYRLMLCAGQQVSGQGQPLLPQTRLTFPRPSCQSDSCQATWRILLLRSLALSDHQSPLTRRATTAERRVCMFVFSCMSAWLQ